MKGHPDVIQLLGRVLRKELTGINQYFVHAKMCQNWGYQALAKHSYDESIDEMRHAEKIIDRIIFLEAIPNMTGIDKVLVGETVRQQLENDRSLEEAALDVLRPGIDICNKAHDHATRELLEHIIVDEENHVEWIDSQLHQIKEVGYENYLAQQIYNRSGDHK